jgi:phosphate starvation-inducible PhoH-like protein
VLEALKQLVERRGAVAADDVRRALAQVTGGNGSVVSEPTIEVPDASRQIRPRTAGQSRYVTAIRNHELVFAVGPAGTGKTYLAVAMAVECLKRREVRRIVLVRPAVEAGESLGFLPGDLQAKINPYLRPLLDALHEMMDHDLIKAHMERDVIEVVPLAYMRGRTLNEAFVILDEAQNTTVSQMKMFLTRMGEGSRMVVSGDITQIDLPLTVHSGLLDALHRLRSIRGISIVELDESDIVRHRLVQDIVQAYEEHPTRRQRPNRS